MDGFIFQNLFPRPLITLQRAQKLNKKIQQNLEEDHNQWMHNYVQNQDYSLLNSHNQILNWVPPSNDFIKINIDAAFHYSSSFTGLAVLARDGGCSLSS